MAYRRDTVVLQSNYPEENEINKTEMIDLSNDILRLKHLLQGINNE